MFLPIVDRELLVASRQQATYRLRVGAASIVLLIVAGMLAANHRLPDGSGLGMQIFRLVTLLSFAFSLMSGVFLTADTVSEEKREGTLGLLFLTDLRSWDILLGKLIAQSMGAVYALLTVFPVLGIPLLLGGVAPGEYGRGLLAIVNALCFSLSAGLFISTISLSQQKAVVGTLVFVMGIAGILPGLSLTLVPGTLGLLKKLLAIGPQSGAASIMLGGMFDSLIHSNSKLLLASPGYAYYLCFDANYKANPSAFWNAIAVGLALSAFFLAGSMVWIRRAVRGSRPRRPAGKTRGSKPRLPGWWIAWRRRAHLRWLAINPVFVAARRGWWPHAFTWTMVGLVTVNVFWLVYGMPGTASNPIFQRYFGNTIFFINRIWITVLACQFFLDARRSGALELLLVTPVPVKSIIQGQWLALKKVLGWPVFVIGLLHVFYVMARFDAVFVKQQSVFMFQFHAITAAGSFLRFLGDVFALSWVGMWLSLSMRRPGWAIVQTFLLVTVIPWLVFYFIEDARAFATTNGLLGHYTIMALLWLLKDALFIVWAWWRLRRGFRAAASQSLWSSNADRVARSEPSIQAAMGAK